MKIELILEAVPPGNNETITTVDSGQGAGGSGEPVADGTENELSTLCEEVACLQLLKHVTSLQRVLATVKKKSVR